MADWAALVAAAQRLHAVATQESLAARSVERADELRHARDTLTRLYARLHATRAVAHAREQWPAVEGNDISVAQAAEDALVSQKVFQLAAQSSSLVRLFCASSLAAEPAELKQDIKENMQKLTDLEVILDELHKGNREKEAKLADLNKKWDKLSKELIDKKGECMEEVQDVEEEGEKYPEKLKFESLVKKMETMREFLCRFLTARSGYDFLEDKDNLMSMLHYTRRPFTVESVLKEIKEA